MTALEPGSISATASEIEGAEVEALGEAEIEGATYTTGESAIAPEPEFEDELEDEAEPAEGLSSEPEDEMEDEFEDESELEGELEDESDSESTPGPRPPAKLERLQKILAQAGVASRRKAEEMIEQGRVQVNGKTVTELGTKADSGRDHIRVDGKLLHGSERLRYYVLNKPKGFVTTVKDPEGRPTVMQFFDKLKERLYPVGRLDYMSEGLLLVTNDGELANRLTRASAGVEKTYLVKVAGQFPPKANSTFCAAESPSNAAARELGQVRTAPARIRQVRQGDNPWYEVVLIEGRNRELRKMFEEIGHFVEKIRRVGYGPLVLDQEPGNLRELDPNANSPSCARQPTARCARPNPRKSVAATQPTQATYQLSFLNPALGPAFAPPIQLPQSPLKCVRLPAPKTTFPSVPSSPASGRAIGRNRQTRPAVQPAGTSAHRGRSSRPAWKKDDRPSAPSPRVLPQTQPANPVRPPANPSEPSRLEKSHLEPSPSVPNHSARSRPTESAPSRPFTPRPELEGGQTPPAAGRFLQADLPHPGPSPANPLQGAASPRSRPGRSRKASRGRRSSVQPMDRPAPPRREPVQHSTTISAP